MSHKGQKLRFGDVRVTSALPLKADLHRKDRNVSKVPKAGLLFQCGARHGRMTWAAKEKRFGFLDAWAQSSLAEIRFSQMLPNLTWLNDWRNICRAGFPIHQAPRISSFLGDVGHRPE
jgi:hypothetical protein